MAVARNADGRMEVFARGNDNALIHNWQVGPNRGWANNWVSLGGQIKHYPAVGRNVDGRLEVFAVGADSALWHIWQTAPNNGWSGWHSLGGQLESAPVVGQNADGRLEVFGLGTDNALYHKYQGGPIDGWSDWEFLGGELQRDLGVSKVALFDVGRNADGRLEAFAIWSDNSLQHSWQNEPNSRGHWSGWAPLGGTLSNGTPPAAALNADGRLEVFACAPNGSLWHIWQTAPNGGWSGWHSLGGILSNSPAVGRNADGRLEVFGRGLDNALWHKWQGGPIDGWSDWESLPSVRVAPGPAAHDGSFPTVGQNADGRLQVFVRRSEDAKVLQIWQGGPHRGWSNWDQLGGWSATALGRGLID